MRQHVSEKIYVGNLLIKQELDRDARETFTLWSKMEKVAGRISYPGLSIKRE